MKKTLITAILVLATIGLSAQNVTFGARAGLNLSSMMPAGKTTPLNDGFDMRMAPNFGIFTELQVNPTISFRLGVEYSGLGGTRNGMQGMPSQRLVNEIAGGLGMIGMVVPDLMEQVMGFMNQWSAASPFYFVDVENTVKFDYVTIPLTAQFGWDIGQSPWRFYAGAGPFVSFILSAEQVTRGTSRMFTDMTGTLTLWELLSAFVPDEFEGILATLGIAETLTNFESGTTEITGEMRSVNFGITGNLGLRYSHNRHNFFLEVGGNFGFMPVQQNTDNGGNRLAAMSVVLGYSLSLW